MNPFQNYRSRSGGARAQLETLEPAIVMQNDEIGERTSRVNPDSHSMIPYPYLCGAGWNPAADW
jgi:hypothetical protein